VHPECRHTLDECGTYSWRQDRLTGAAIAEPVDRNNHIIDSLRYALVQLIRNQPTAGYFNRAALLLPSGEPVDADRGDRPMRVFSVAAITERSGTAVGLIHFALRPFGAAPYLLTVLDYDVVELAEGLSADWLMRVFARAQELRGQWNAVEPVTALYVERGELLGALGPLLSARLLGDGVLAAGLRPPFDLIRADPEDLGAEPTLEARARECRTPVNGGGLVKLSRTAYTRQVTHRAESTNHLSAQLFGYQPAADVAQELVAALTLGCILGRAWDRRMPSSPPAPLAQAAPAPPAPWQYVPSIPLAPGPHEIDGVGVDVPVPEDNPGCFLVSWPLRPGRHVVDGRVCIVAGPGVPVR